MSLEDIVKGASIPAILLGIGLASLAPMLIHGLSGNSRPVAKNLLHRYLDMAEKFKELGAEAQEQWRDLLAEVQAERQAREAAEIATPADAAREM